VYISLPTTVGYLISWSAIRLIAAHFTWRYAFFIPAICAAAFLVIWITFLQPAPPSFVLPTTPSEKKRDGISGKKSPYQLLIVCGLIFVGLAAIVQGLIKESINLWAPTLIADIGSAARNDIASLYAVGVPIAGTVGILAVSRLLRAFHNSSFKTLLVLFIAAAISAGAVFLFRPPFFVSVLLLSTLMACVCGANVIITVFLPTGFVRQGLSTQVSGTLNFMVYVGAGVGGGLSGLVSDLFGWNSLYLLWSALCLVALGVLIVWRKQQAVA
jgi:sugar phosphate permease